MRRIVSYAFFRNDSSAYEHPNCGEARGRVFLNYVRLIVRAHWAVWRPYELRIAHDDRVMEFPYFKAMQRMRDDGILNLVPFGRSESLCGRGGMLERMRPVWELGVDYVVCRDLDSVPMPRDRRCVEEFIRSGRTCHTIHDASAHAGLMGGTMAVDAKRFPSAVQCSTWDAFITRGDKLEVDFTKHGADQHLLNLHWHQMRREILIHELHHNVGDMPGCEIVRSISIPPPDDIPAEVAAVGDSFSSIIGGCAAVDPAFAFYDSLPIEEIRKIKDCERGVA